MKEQKEEKNLEVGDIIARTGAFFEKNKKNITIIACAVIVVAAGIWAYFGLYANPRQQQATEEMFAAEHWFGEGDFEKALNGDEQFPGFLQVIDEYGNTKAGNLARYYAAVCEMNLAKYDDAIAHLKSYKGRDIFTGAEVAMLIGDAYAEQHNFAEAAVAYEKAARASDNSITAPAALWKAGISYLALDKKNDAKRCFATIKDKYTESSEWMEVDKYISYAENKEVK